MFCFVSPFPPLHMILVYSDAMSSSYFGFTATTLNIEHWRQWISTILFIAKQPKINLAWRKIYQLEFMLVQSMMRYVLLTCVFCFIVTLSSVYFYNGIFPIFMIYRYKNRSTKSRSMTFCKQWHTVSKNLQAQLCLSHWISYCVAIWNKNKMKMCIRYNTVWV